MSGLLAKTLEIALATSGSSFIDDFGMKSSAVKLVKQAHQVAEILLRHGVQNAEPVHLAIGNRPIDIGSMLGIWLAGAVAVPTHISASTTTKAALAKATASRFLVEGTTLQKIADIPPPSRPLLKGAALIIFTSGTTGLPKGVVIGHDAFAGKLQILDRLIPLRTDDIVLLPLQLTFIFGIWVALLALISGSNVILVPKFSSGVAAKSLTDGTTIFAAVPTMLRNVLAASTPKASSLRLVLTGGEILGPALSRRLGDVWPHTGVYDLYGSTETGSCDFCLQPDARMAGLGSIGGPTEDVHFRLAGIDNSPALEGDIGEIQIRSPYGMLGYLDDPLLTQTSFSGGFFKTGDLGRLRSDHRVEIVGRLKEIISRGGNKISPLEIDNVLCSHPHVAAALCTGVPDARLGEAIHAIVVLESGATLASADLLEWAAQRIEPFKLPDAIFFREALPLGNTGKASRSAVKDIVTTGNSD